MLEADIFHLSAQEVSTFLHSIPSAVDDIYIIDIGGIGQCVDECSVAARITIDLLDVYVADDWIKAAL